MRTRIDHQDGAKSRFTRAGVSGGRSTERPSLAAVSLWGKVCSSGQVFILGLEDTTAIDVTEELVPSPVQHVLLCHVLLRYCLPGV